VRFEITAFIGVIVLAGVVVVPMTLRLGEGAEIGSQYHWPVANVQSAVSTDSDFVTPKNTNLDSENVPLFV
jgi:hypothetical protein